MPPSPDEVEEILGIHVFDPVAACMAAEEDEHLQVLDLAAQTIDNASQFVYLTFRQMCKCFLHTEGILCQYTCKMPKKNESKAQSRCDSSNKWNHEIHETHEKGLTPDV
jgi:hypothetical protein